MSDITLVVRDGTQAVVDMPAPIQIDIDQKRGPQGPAGPSSGSLIGSLGDLTTEDKSTVVAAINELNMDGVSLLAIYNNAKAG